MKEGKNVGMPTLYFWAVVAIAIATMFQTAALVPMQNFAVQLEADVTDSPPQITLRWVPDGNATSYAVARKKLNENGWSAIATLAGDVNSYSDQNVSDGAAFEYQVIRTTNAGYTGYGYIYAGVNAPLVENRGTIVLIAEQSIAAALDLEIGQWKDDVNGDGWKVVQHTVTADQTPNSVKDLIKADYQQDPAGTKAVLLLGHVPVPYSGDIAPDGHPNHQGAWPADVYYGDMEGAWTDSTVTSTNAERTVNWNVPGDGKFDQSQPPGEVQLEIGRVDLSNLTCFANKVPSRNEVDLTRFYFLKNHNFRQGKIPIDERALMYDNYDWTATSPEAYMAFAFRNARPLVGTNLDVLGNWQFMPAVAQKSYLLGSCFSGGSYVWQDGAVSSDQLATETFNVVFATFCGSYLGDWNVESGLLRSALGANGTILASAFVGQPAWYLHPMGLGETLGFCVRLTQNNKEGGTYPPQIRHAAGVHVALLGDPTLRFHPIMPPAQLTGSAENGAMTLTWASSSAEHLKGYAVYKQRISDGEFTRMGSELVAGTTFTDSAYAEGDRYMVRAVALTTSPSGTYWNGSEGLFFPGRLPAQSEQGAPPAPLGLSASVTGPNQVQLNWLVKALTATKYVIERKAFGAADYQIIASVDGNTAQYVDSSAGTGAYSYRVQAQNAAGASPYSNEASVTTVEGSVTFVNADSSTIGNWKGVYGKEGYLIRGDSSNVPPFMSMTTSNVYTFGFGATEDPRALTRAESNQRVTGCWTLQPKGELSFSFLDDRPHRVAIYFMDFSSAGRNFTIAASDGISGKAYDSRSIPAYDGGLYLVYDIIHSGRFTITPGTNANTLFFGIFLDPAELSAPVMTPDGGVFAGQVKVSIAPPIRGAEVRYTLDGSAPTENSSVYSSPIALSDSTTVLARAYKAGYDPGPVVSKLFINGSPTRAVELGWDESAQGTWAKRFGSEGYMVAAAEKQIPSYAELSLAGGQPWIWNGDVTNYSAPYSSLGATQRIASCWYGDAWTLNLSVWDTKAHSIGLYFLDWDAHQRRESVEVTDLAGRNLGSFEVADFANGKYLFLAIQGAVQIKFTKIEGDNAVLSGIFFDPAPAPLNQPIPLRQQLALTKDGLVHLNLSGEVGFAVCTDGSGDFATWTCLATNVLSTNAIDVAIPLSDAPGFRFFRSHYLQ